MWKERQACWTDSGRRKRLLSRFVRDLGNCFDTTQLSTRQTRKEISHATVRLESGTGAVPPVGGKQPNLYREILKNFENAARERGKNLAQMPKLIELNVEYTNDAETSIQFQKKYWAGIFV